jgi:hypothetical protein
MKHIPFVAFPPAEQNGLLAVLRQVGMAPSRVCASRIEAAESPSGSGATVFTTVTAPGLSWTHEDRNDECWLSALERELSLRR